MSFNSIYPDDNVIWFHPAFFCWSMAFWVLCCCWHENDDIKLVTLNCWRHLENWSRQLISVYTVVLLFVFWCGSWISVWIVVLLLFQIYYTCTRKYFKSRQNRRYIWLSMPKYPWTLLILCLSMIKLEHEKTEMDRKDRRMSQRIEQVPARQATRFC